MVAKFKYVSSLCVLLHAVFAVGCQGERPTKVVIEDGPIPTFRLSGSGNLSSFSVYLVPPSPEKMDTPFSQQVPVWQISAQPDPMHGRGVEQVRTLTYGVVPAGYKETFPGNDSAAPSIEPEKTYFYSCDTTDAPPTAGFFMTHDGKVIPTQAKTPCWSSQNGKWVAVPCLK